MAFSRWRHFRLWLSTAVEHEKREALAHGEEPHLREQFFDFKSLSPSLKVLTGTVIAQVVAGAAGLAGVLKCCGMTDLGDASIQLPSQDYVLAYVSLIFGLFLITMGMASARWAGTSVLLAAMVVFFTTAFFGYFPLSYLGGAVSILLTTVMWIVLVCTVPNAYRARYSPERQHVWVLYLLLGFGFGLWAVVLWAGPYALATMLILLHQALVFFYVLTGTDWAELSDTVIRFATNRFLKPNTRPSAVLYATMLAAAALIVVTFVRSPARIMWFVPAYAVAGVAVFAALRLARFHAGWPARFSWPILAAVAFSAIFGGVAVYRGATLTAVELIYVFFMAGLLIAGGRSRHYAVIGPAALLGLIYSLATLMMVTFNVPYLKNLGPEGIFFAAATMTLLSAAWFLWRCRGGAAVTRPATLLFVFIVGLWTLYVLWAVIYAMIIAAGKDAAIAAGVLLLVTVLIDVSLSGGSITNVDGKLFPRAARVRLFFGYVLLVVSSVLFWQSLQASDELKAIAELYSPDFFVQAGIAGYGVAMLTALAVLRIAHWRAGLARPDVISPS